MMQGRLHVEGAGAACCGCGRCRRRTSSWPTWWLRAGRIDPDLMYRALPYLVEPEWTRGHAFTVRYEVIGEGGGAWNVEVRDGERLRVTAGPDGERRSPRRP